MTRCEDCLGDHAPRVAGEPCPCCEDASSTCAVPCPGCEEIPADRVTGYAVTVWVEGPATQDAADALVRDMLEVALPGAPEGTTADVVPA